MLSEGGIGSGECRQYTCIILINKTLLIDCIGTNDLNEELERYYSAMHFVPVTPASYLKSPLLYIPFSNVVLQLAVDGS